MKKISLLIFFTCSVFCLQAQKKDTKPGFRKQTPAETQFLNSLHQSLYTSLPHVYKDWKTAPENSFDAIKYWCDIPTQWHDCTADIPTSIGHGDPWALNWQVDFTMPDEQSSGLMMAAMKGVTDYTNGQQVATCLKATNKSKLGIFIYANISSGVTGAFPISYCGKTPPVTIPLPVAATLAVKGIRSADCPLMDGGHVSMSGNYYDNAVVFLGKPVSSKTTATGGDGLTTIRYAIGFDKARIGKLVVQNIVVTFKGDSADIDEAIKLIDWQKLSDLIER